MKKNNDLLKVREKKILQKRITDYLNNQIQDMEETINKSKDIIKYLKEGIKRYDKGIKIMKDNLSTDWINLDYDQMNKIYDQLEALEDPTHPLDHGLIPYFHTPIGGFDGIAFNILLNIKQPNFKIEENNLFKFLQIRSEDDFHHLYVFKSH